MIHRCGQWRGGHGIGSVYIVGQDEPAYGNNWMKGRLRPGEFVLCVAHTGDCFYDFVLLDCFANGIRAILQSRFGAYDVGPLVVEPRYVLTDREFHLLMAGEKVERPIEKTDTVSFGVIDLGVPVEFVEQKLRGVEKLHAADMLPVGAQFKLPPYGGSTCTVLSKGPGFIEVKENDGGRFQVKPDVRVVWLDDPTRQADSQ